MRQQTLVDFLITTLERMPHGGELALQPDESNIVSGMTALAFWTLERDLAEEGGRLWWNSLATCWCLSRISMEE